MSKVRYKLRLVTSVERPLASLTIAEKRAAAIAYLRSRSLYLLDKGTPAKWGIPQAGAKK